MVLPNWFGDVLFATSFLTALKERAPSARMAALGVGRAQEILQGHPALDELIRLDEPAGGDFSRGWRLIARLRAGRFDAAFLLRRSASRTALAWLAGIPRRVGAENVKTGWMLTDRIPPPREPCHRAAGYLRLLAALGADAQPPRARPPEYRYYPSDEERAFAAALLRRHGIGAEEPFVALHPGANWPHKRWAAERFGELAVRLAAAGWRVALTGAPEDEPWIRDVAGRLSPSPVVLAGGTTLRQAAACLERARLVVAGDTGVLHLACAMGRPVLGLYGPTAPSITGPLAAPERAVVIHHSDCCPSVPCYAPEHPGHPGMASISVEEVLDAARILLTGSTARQQ